MGSDYVIVLLYVIIKFIGRRILGKVVIIKTYLLAPRGAGPDRVLTPDGGQSLTFFSSYLSKKRLGLVIIIKTFLLVVERSYY